MSKNKANRLSVRDLKAGYDGTRILDGISFDLRQGERLGILGRNGVGKTTTLATIMGLTEIHGGGVFLDDLDVTKQAPHVRARLGLGYVPQTRDVFKSLTVSENLIAAASGDYRESMAAAYQAFPRLAERQDNYGDQLSGGEQQMLAVARALMVKPTIMLLDEPLEGLAPLVGQDLMKRIVELTNETGVGCILVEQNVDMVLDFATRVIILERGLIVYEGTPTELRDQPQLMEAYIGLNKEIDQ